MRGAAIRPSRSPGPETASVCHGGPAGRKAPRLAEERGPEVAERSHRVARTGAPPPAGTRPRRTAPAGPRTSDGCCSPGPRKRRAGSCMRYACMAVITTISCVGSARNPEWGLAAASRSPPHRNIPRKTCLSSYFSLRSSPRRRETDRIRCQYRSVAIDRILSINYSIWTWKFQASREVPASQTVDGVTQFRCNGNSG